MGVRTLLIDNYDSYSYNLYQLIAQVNQGRMLSLVVFLLSTTLFCYAALYKQQQQPLNKQPTLYYINAEPPTVIYNNQLDIDTLLEDIKQNKYDNIVISPGPGTPEHPEDIGICVDIFKSQVDIPVLGVCLGHQALAVAFGAIVIHAPAPVHGRLSALKHTRHPLFTKIPSGDGYQVVRYHSLVVDPGSLPDCLEPIAWTMGKHHALDVDRAATHESLHHNGDEDEPATPSPTSLQGLVINTPTESSSDRSTSSGSSTHSSPPREQQQFKRTKSYITNDGLLMGLAHKELPYYSVQYHPESVATGYGVQLLTNFRDLTLGLDHSTTSSIVDLSTIPLSARQSLDQNLHGSSGNLHLCIAKLPGILDQLPGGTEQLFSSIVLDASSVSDNKTANTFWLDSSSTDRGRFSFMGGPGGALWRRMSYSVDSSTVTVVDTSGVTSTIASTFWPWLSSELSQWRCNTCSYSLLEQSSNNQFTTVNSSPFDLLPFNFWGGYVGYLGYELKAECDGAVARVPTSSETRVPDAAMFLADQMLAIDHLTGVVYVVGLSSSSDGAADTKAWVSATAQKILDIAASSSNDDDHSTTAPLSSSTTTKQLEVTIREPRQQYLKNIGACMKALYDGDSYEICLTTMLHTILPQGFNPWTLYKTLRRVNPAPYAAWLQLGDGTTSDGVSVCCSSPERFLRGDRKGTLEAKPIKGTAKRILDDPVADSECANALESSEKDRAENLMIVDLLRNDLGRVCEIGSVHVPALMHIESFATVHQLVSTVQGTRKQDTTVVDCIKAAFPGGSMTGAPKIRTMQIIDSLETGPRGIYSGSLGYISFNDTFDLNIVIRTAVVSEGGHCSIGAGGAIVVQSEAVEEWDEMRLKSSALMTALEKATGADVVVNES